MTVAIKKKASGHNGGSDRVVRNLVVVVVGLSVGERERKMEMEGGRRWEHLVYRVLFIPAEHAKQQRI